MLISRTAIAASAAALALLLAAGCGSGSSSTSTPSSSAPEGFFGMDAGIAYDAQDSRQMAAAGVETVRRMLPWSVVQPQSGPYNWRLPDAQISQLAANGIEFLPVLASTPGWVATPATTPPIDSPEAKYAWTQFLKAAVARYGPGGTFWEPAAGGGPSPFQALCHCDAKPVPVTSWQVWNEPSLSHYFTASAPVESYAQLLQMSHDAITSVDPNAQIVLAGVPGFAKGGELNAWKFFDELVHTPGTVGAFDVVALHPYSRSIGQLEMEVKKMRAAMDKNGDEGMPLWITEMGWGSDPPDRFGFNQGIDGQKQLLTQAYSLLLRERAAWNLDRVYWFDWRDPPASAKVGCSFCASAGLLTSDRQPKPAYDAFKTFTQDADE